MAYLIVAVITSQTSPYVSALDATSKPKTIVIQAGADHLQGRIQVPASTLTGYFLEWEETKEGDKVLYSQGWLSAFAANIERGQVDRPGIADDLSLELTFDFENMRVTGSLTGKAVSLISFPPETNLGETIVLDRGSYGSNLLEATCEATLSCDLEGDLVEKWLGTYDYSFKVMMSVVCSADISVSPGYYFQDREIWLEESRTIVREADCSGRITYSTTGVTANFNLYVMDMSLEGISLSISPDWGTPCTVAEITEWYEDTQVTISGPATLGPSDTEATYTLSLGTLKEEDIEKTEWTIDYLDSRGYKNSLPTQTFEETLELSIPEEGEFSLKKMRALTVSEGASKDGYTSMEFYLTAKAFKLGNVVAESDAFTIIYSIKEECIATIMGPTSVSLDDETAFFKIEATGEGLLLLSRPEWYYSYQHKTAGWMDDIFARGKLNVTVNRQGEYFTIENLYKQVSEYGVYSTEKSGYPIKIFFKGTIGGKEVTSEKFEFTLTSEASIPTGGRITLYDYPMKYIEAAFNDGKNTVVKITDDEGYFESPDFTTVTGSYIVELRFRYTRDGVSYFMLMAPGEQEPLKVKMNIVDQEIESAALIMNEDSQVILETGGSIRDLKLEELMTPGNGALTYARVYLHTYEALEFYKDYLGEQVQLNLPLLVYTFTTVDQTRYAYEDGKSVIEINLSQSGDNSPTRPKEREWHEFSHYMMHNLYGDFPKPPEDSIPEVNHDGYINPSTSDSYVEGFAYFMALVIGEHYENRWYPPIPDVLAVNGAAEPDSQVWDKAGKNEDFAVAQVLWDLYDGPAQVEAGMEMSVEIMTLLYREALRELDFNANGYLDKTEFFLWKIDPMPSDDYLNNKADTMIYVYGSNQQISASRLTEVDLSDIGLDEALTLVEAQQLVKEFDRDSSGGLDTGEVFQLQRFMIIENAEEKSQSRSDLPEKVTLEDYLSEAKQLKDDDGVDLTLQEVWSVLRVYHTDFTSVYEAFHQRFSGKAQDIDQIFIAHGFYADEGEGNRKWDPGEPYRDLNKDGEYSDGETYVDYPKLGFKYDEGEVVGQATNYARQERRSVPWILSQYVEMDTEVPFYNVTIEFYDGLPYVSPTRTLVLWQRAEAGRVYIPVPTADNAMIRVTPVGVIYGSPLVFDSNNFTECFQEALTQGYYERHNFNVVGSIPLNLENQVVIVSIPKESAPSQTTSTTSGGGIPGYPIESVAFALVALIAIIRNRRGAWASLL